MLLVQDERHWLVVVFLILGAETLALDGWRHADKLGLATFVAWQVWILIER